MVGALTRLVAVEVRVQILDAFLEFCLWIDMKVRKNQDGCNIWG
jgi:hypothetical protein